MIGQSRSSSVLYLISCLRQAVVSLKIEIYLVALGAKSVTCNPIRGMV
jgi:hypothetical protein